MQPLFAAPHRTFFLELVLFKLLKLNREDLTAHFTYGVLGLPLAFGLAYLSYHFVEKKFLELKKRF